MGTRLSFVGATVVAFTLATLVWVWPLLPWLGTAYLQQYPQIAGLARADAYLTSWMLAWGAHALRTDPLGVYHANVFHPLPWTLAFSENLFAGALLILPVDVVWGNPTLDHNALLLASFVLGGVGTALLLRELGAAWPAAWLGGALVTFGPFRFATVGHVQALSTHWMPFALLAVQRCIRRGRGAWAVALTVTLVSLSSIYYAYFFFIALAVFVPAHWFLGAPAAPGGRRRAVAGIVAAAVATGSILLPYMWARDVYALGRDAGEAWFLAARIWNYVGPLVDPVDYVRHRYVLREPGQWLLGIGTLGLMMVGTAAGAARGGRRTSGVYLAMGLALALVSMGPLIEWRPVVRPSAPGPWSLLAAIVPGFAALRVSIRACTPALLAFGVLAGLGADALWRRTHGTAARAAMLVLFGTVAVFDCWRPRFTLMPAPVPAGGVPAVYEWLGGQAGRDAVVELPIGNGVADAEWMVMSAAHWKPLVNGYSGFTPTSVFFREALAGFPDPESLRLLHDIGVRWVIVHPTKVPRAQAALCDPATALPPELERAYRDPTACVLVLHGAPPAALPPADRPVSLDGATVRVSSGDSPAAHDGRLETHWIEPVSSRTEGTLEIDLGAPHDVSRVLIELGPHFGEFLRQWRVDTSLDGVTWTVGAVERNGTPPVVDMRRDPSRLTQTLHLPPGTTARHLRIVRPGGDEHAPGVWLNWTRWGIHEIRVFETAS